MLSQHAAAIDPELRERTSVPQVFLNKFDPSRSLPDSEGDDAISTMYINMSDHGQACLTLFRG